MKSIQVHGIFDPASSTLTYVVWDRTTLDALVIDPVLDYDPATQITSRVSIEKVKMFVGEMGLRVHWILDTHVHADHLSGARELKALWPWVNWGVSARMNVVFENFRKVFHWPP